MIITMKPGTPIEEIEQLIEKLSDWKVTPQKITGKHKVAIGLIGETAQIELRQIQASSPFLEKVIRIDHPFKQAS